MDGASVSMMRGKMDGFMDSKEDDAFCCGVSVDHAGSSC